MDIQDLMEVGRDVHTSSFKGFAVYSHLLTTSLLVIIRVGVHPNPFGLLKYICLAYLLLF